MDEQTSPSVEPTSLPTEPVLEVAPVAESTAPAPVPETETLPSSPMPETEPAQAVGNEPCPPPSPVAETLPTHPPTAVATPTSRVREFLQMARESITGRKKKKLETIMTYLEKHTEITNDAVEKLLRVSDATATRYLGELTKQGKIVRTDATGRGVTYRKA